MFWVRCVSLLLCVYCNPCILRAVYWNLYVLVAEGWILYIHGAVYTYTATPIS